MKAVYHDSVVVAGGTIKPLSIPVTAPSTVALSVSKNVTVKVASCGLSVILVMITSSILNLAPAGLPPILIFAGLSPVTVVISFISVAVSSRSKVKGPTGEICFLLF
jgi:hypothetical protein